MTSYNKDPGPTNNLNEYLLHLSGFSKTDGIKSTQPLVITKEHATDVGNLMTNWLPSLLAMYQLPGSYSQNYSEHGYRDEGCISEEVVQEWGTIPNAIDMLETGRLVEIAGPSSTVEYSRFFNGVIPKIMMNISSEIDGVTVAGDVRHAPFANESIGILFISDLPGAPREYLKLYSTLRPEAIAEATRILQPNGYFIWLGGTTDDVQDIINSGFTPQYLHIKSSINKKTGSLSEQYTDPFLTVDGVYKKVSK
jgi:hypothetical protein